MLIKYTEEGEKSKENKIEMVNIGGVLERPDVIDLQPVPNNSTQLNSTQILNALDHIQCRIYLYAR